jgi:hypothetical protein
MCFVGITPAWGEFRWPSLGPRSADSEISSVTRPMRKIAPSAVPVSRNGRDTPSLSSSANAL